MTQTKPPRIIACPRCKKSTTFDPSNHWRPFCSERCKTIDIAAWADEQYVFHEEIAENVDLEQLAQNDDTE
jgi:endogenous inhibitor of DNA gyrase (YacG/DUF329 family)